MIRLHTFPGTETLPSVSPFCLKMDTWFRLAGVEFERIETDPRGSPKGKLPYIHDGDEIVADTSFIIAHMKERHGVDLDAGMTDAERGAAHFLRKTLEESYYFYLTYSRWIDDAGWAAFRPTIAASVPAAVRFFLPALLRRGQRSNLWGQGTARHASGEVERLAKADLDAIEGVLGDRRFLFGDDPRTVDATAFAMLYNSLAGSPAFIKTAVEERPGIVAYCERVKDKIGLD